MSKSPHDNAMSSLFDQMYAVNLKEPAQVALKPTSTESVKIAFQGDIMDALALLKGPLLEYNALKTGSAADIAVFAELLRRHNQCEKLLAATAPSNSSTRAFKLSEISFSIISKFIADAQNALKCNLTDESTWGGKLPEALLLKDLYGGRSIVEIENEEEFMVRGSSYLADYKKVLMVCFIFVNICASVVIVLDTPYL